MTIARREISVKFWSKLLHFCTETLDRKDITDSEINYQEKICKVVPENGTWDLVVFKNLLHFFMPATEHLIPWGLMQGAVLAPGVLPGLWGHTMGVCQDSAHLFI